MIKVRRPFAATSPATCAATAACSRVEGGKTQTTPDVIV
jgi:hypothetical protein